MLKETRNLPQAALGRLLATTQQNVQRLLSVPAAGFSYESATRLVREIGYVGVDAFFASKGLGIKTPLPSDSDDEQRAKSA